MVKNLFLLSEPLRWFCAVKIGGQITAKTTDLTKAQKSLGAGNQNNRQAIIPMANQKAEDPHTISKTWDKGSMYWYGWDDIRKMQSVCQGTAPPSRFQRK